MCEYNIDSQRTREGEEGDKTLLMVVHRVRMGDSQGNKKDGVDDSSEGKT